MKAISKAVEGAVPASAMPFQLFDGLEYSLAKGQFGFASFMLGESDSDQGFGARAAIFTLSLPGEGEDQARRFHDFAIDAALPEVPAAIVRAQA